MHFVGLPVNCGLQAHHKSQGIVENPHPCLDSQLSLYQHHNAKAKGLRLLVMLMSFQVSYLFVDLALVVFLRICHIEARISYTEEDRKSKSKPKMLTTKWKDLAPLIWWCPFFSVAFRKQNTVCCLDLSLCSSWPSNNKITTTEETSVLDREQGLSTMIYFLHDNRNDFVLAPRGESSGPGWPCSAPPCQMTDTADTSCIKYISIFYIHLRITFGTCMMGKGVMPASSNFDEVWFCKSRQEIWVGDPMDPSAQVPGYMEEHRQPSIAGTSCKTWGAPWAHWEVPSWISTCWSPHLTLAHPTQCRFHQNIRSHRGHQSTHQSTITQFWCWKQMEMFENIRKLKNNFRRNPTQAVRAGPNFQTQRPRFSRNQWISMNVWLQGFAIRTWEHEQTWKNQRFQFPNPSPRAGFGFHTGASSPRKHARPKAFRENFPKLPTYGWLENIPLFTVSWYLPQKKDCGCSSRLYYINYQWG